ncbi:phage tail sheath C-terminal domain-containing protein [Bacteroides oleiciplenus]|uniref:phage tail sheath C-terminal domain-containing protein n=1 Tax=Bacteroides oleiciplenus TaxID=626931 RepID=UPI0026DBBF53|nr:phage tail sheath C-terminal domain-containing protein [Bacteroides oleiciplenus]
MGNMKTPGVYIVEKNAFPNSVVEASTAIPAFIGITEKAQNGNDDLTGIPWKISSMTEYLQYFGGAPELKFNVDIKKYFYLSKEQKKADPKKTLVEALVEPVSKIFKYCVCPVEEIGKVTFDKDNVGTETKTGGKGEDTPVGYAFCVDGENKYTLYYNMMLFFANGGSTCYVVSMGGYGDSKNTLVDKKVETALNALKKIQEVTLIIVPEAVETDACAKIQQLMLKHCGEMANRFTILDMPPKYPGNSPLDTHVETFQGNIGSNYLSYGAAYFPWLNTSVLGDRDLDGGMFSWTMNADVYAKIAKFSQTDSQLQKIVDFFLKTTILFEEDKSKENETVSIGGKKYKYEEVKEKDLKKDLGEKFTVTVKEDLAATPHKKTITLLSPDAVDKNDFHQALVSGSILYQQAMKAVKKYLNLLPPSAAMAGIYTMVDNSRGVWKAPANVTLNYVDSTTEDIDDEQQAGLNAPMNGKAINVIRPFRGEGVKVWGARTLDGNSLDWRYINVRRTLLFLEESVKNASRAYVFEPNDAGTWINMKCMIESFLRSVWKRGGLAGATPEDAFSVHVGLGDTMTADDILEGIMRITVLVAVTHPAEFIEITFQQQMQKS